MNIFQQYLSYGLSVIPCSADKRAQFAWKQYQDAPASMEEAGAWSGAIAIVCGRVSGGVVCIDFDTKNGDQYNPWLMLINENYPELLSKMVVETSPSGGYHVVFRTNKIIKNIKLANNAAGAATIETRGEGGYFLCAPSPGYELFFGSFAILNTITDEETEIVLSVAASLNEKRQETTAEAPKIDDRQAMHITSGLTPFDDYNARHDVIGLLQAHGWKLVFSKGTKAYFQRPGKDGRGVSATWGAVPDRFYVFSTTTQFENNHVYKASAVYAILEHSGNYSEAARALYAKGFGDRVQKQPTNSHIDKIEQKAPKKIGLLDITNITQRMHDIKKNGYTRGLSTGWKMIDQIFTVVKGQFTVITGMPSSGKSEFVDALALNLAVSSGWKFAVFSPENYPCEMHMHKLIEKKVRKELREMDISDLEDAIIFISKHFFFIDGLEEDIDLVDIYTKTEELIKDYKIDALILDPWNEIELSKPKDISDSDFIGVCLRKSRKFARKHNIHLFIVAHPTKMQKDKSGEYPVVELYDIAGSAHWRNKADNGICVHRDYSDNSVMILTQKIKYRFSGKPGAVRLIYDIKTGTYGESSTQTEFDF